jgi:hypothetical protein
MAPVLEPLLLFSQVFCLESKGLVNLEQRQSLLCIYHVFCKKNKAILNSKGYSIMKCHWCMESHHDDHQLRYNI